VHAFLEGTTYRDLVHELGGSPPVDSNELFDITTIFASGEEAVGAIFDGKKCKCVDDVPAEGSRSKEPQQKHKHGKKGKKPHREARAQGRDDDGDEALVVDPARRGPRAAPRGPDIFDDMLKKPCPYHKTLVNHTLEQCDLLQRNYSHAAAKDGEAKKDGGDGDADGSPRWRTSSSSSGDRLWTCPTASASGSGMKSSLRKRLLPPSWTGRRTPLPSAARITRTASPTRASTRWSSTRSSAMRFSKVLMDGGNSLSIIYAHTLRLLGISLDQLRPNTTPFHGVAPSKRIQPLGQIDLSVWFGTSDNFRKETLTFKVLGFRGAHHIIPGRPCYAKFMAVRTTPTSR
jgi:hypothetical protein